MFESDAQAIREFIRAKERGEDSQRSGDTQFRERKTKKDKGCVERNLLKGADKPEME